ncbi:S-adenosylmethionine decarboxylase [Candidatus Woesearchaeota archaeon]|nr:S-adenosylmethionine decarboxylase [Candidatus Woesearchaeota archaeon]
MKNIAPDITRQRLVIEGFFIIPINQKEILAFFKGITKELKLKTYGKPTIHATSNKGKSINQGFDAFVPLIDSGIALYVWGNAQFFSTVIYTCKKFNVKKAVRFTKRFFKAKKIVYEQF